MGLGNCADDAGTICIKKTPSVRVGGMAFSLKRMREDSDPTVVSPSPLKASRRRLAKRHVDDGSDDEENLFRALRNKPWIKYNNDSDVSDDESDFEEMNSALWSSSLPAGVVRGCKSCESCQKVLARWRPDAGCRPGLEDAPVFFPLEEEFQDTVKYIASISAEAAPYGICRIVPPHSWRPPCPLKDSEKRRTTVFPTRVQRLNKLQVRETQVKKEEKKRRGNRVSQSLNATSSDEDGKFGFEPGPLFTLETFEKYAQEFKDEYFGLRDNKNEACNGSVAKGGEPSVECIEGEYWRIVEHATEQLEVLYGADIETGKFGSGFPKAKSGTVSSPYETSGWNLNNIARLGGSVLSFEEEEISGVLVPWLYVGMCLSSFCWHVEDHHFYSLNYMHFGSPKVWYGVPGNVAYKLEDAMKKHLPDLFEEQPDLLHKLVTQLSPSVLKSEGVPVYRAVQRPGEFVVTFPRAYHAGFNCGFNCAEAVNVAPIDWLPAGQHAVELYKQQKRKSTVSHDKLLLGAVSKYLTVLQSHPGLPADAWQESFGGHEILSKVLKDRVELERSRRSNVENFAHTRRMDKSFDAIDAKECSVCHYDLHLSAIACECARDRYTCLEHVQELCTCEKSKKHALYRYEISELDALVAALEGSHDAVYGVDHLLKLFPKLEASQASCDESMKHEGLINYGQVQVSASKTRSSSASVSGSSTIRPVNLDAQIATVKTEAHVVARTPTESIWNGGFTAMSAFLLKDFENFEELLAAGSKTSQVLSVECQVTKPQPTVPIDPSNSPSFPPGYAPSEDLPPGYAPSEDLPPGYAPSEDLPPGYAPSEEKKLMDVIVLSDDEDCPPCSQSASNPCLSINPVVAAKQPGTERLWDSSNGFLLPSQKSDTMASWNMSSHTRPCSQGDRPFLMASEEDQKLSLTLHHTRPAQVPTFDAGLQNCNTKDATAARDWLCLGHLDKPSINQSRQEFSVMGHSFSQIKYEGQSLGSYIANSAAGFTLGNSLHGFTPVAQPQEASVRVELLSTGRLMLGMSWCSKDAIFPAGFRSRVLYTSILDPRKICFYISEILDYSHSEPFFKVSMEDNPNEVFMHGSIDRCWQMVQERVNIMIQLLQSLGNVGLPHTRRPEDIRGLELFGLTSPHIIKAVESLDWRHQCLQYWTGRLSAIGLLQTQHHPQMVNVNESGFLLSPYQNRALLEKATPMSFNSTAMHNLWR